MCAKTAGESSPSTMAKLLRMHGWLVTGAQQQQNTRLCFCKDVTVTTVTTVPNQGPKGEGEGLRPDRGHFRVGRPRGPHTHAPTRCKTGRGAKRARAIAVRLMADALRGLG